VLPPWANFNQIFLAFAQMIFYAFNGNSFGKNAPKDGARPMRCSLLYALKFLQKCWCNRKASFALFTLHQCLRTLQNLVGKIDYWQPMFLRD
jgi:hypothetical protein